MFWRVNGSLCVCVWGGGGYNIIVGLQDTPQDNVPPFLYKKSTVLVMSLHPINYCKARIHNLELHTLNAVLVPLTNYGQLPSL